MWHRKKQRNLTSTQGGFTLIEVLIASAILVASIGILMQLFASSLDRMQKIENKAHMLVTQQVIIQQLGTINPALLSSGSGDAEGSHYQWQTTKSQPFQSIFSTKGKQIERLAALFTITIFVAPSFSNQSYQFEIDKVGWKAGS